MYYFTFKFKAMLLNIFQTLWHLPMVWDFIVPLGVIAIFCAVLFWEGEYGHPIKKSYRIRFKDVNH
jgi:hypothetical protein